MVEDVNIATPRQKDRRMAGALARFTAFGMTALIAAGLMGQAIRDRSVATALMMYIPLMPLGQLVRVQTG